MTSETPKTDAQRAQDAQVRSREDFMKRLFAVAVSVGFASPLTRMDWIANGTAPDKGQWHQIVILVTALLATIGSWEGYFSAIGSRPLKGVWRFFVDITLVLIYMVLLISSLHPYLFLPILVVIFILYVIWDMLTIYEHTGHYYYSVADNMPNRCVVATTYWRGIFPETTEKAVRRGHIITVLWALYFSGLLIMRLVLNFDNIYVMCGMASLGLLGYRKNKRTEYDSNGKEKRKTAYTILEVTLVIVGFLIAAAVLGYTLKA